MLISSTAIKKQKKEISSLKGQIKLAIQRKDYWKKKVKYNALHENTGVKEDD